VAELDVCPVDELPPGSAKIVVAGTLMIGVYNCGGEYLAIEDRCSHDDGPLCEGDWDEEECRVICPRHGSQFDLRSGEPLTLPAWEPVDTFAVRVADGVVRVEVSSAPSGNAV
jgi:3-phenylpropionate/trans-cinnamate dioxygenase ferredoxin subunit